MARPKGREIIPTTLLVFRRTDGPKTSAKHIRISADHCKMRCKVAGRIDKSHYIDNLLQAPCAGTNRPSIHCMHPAAYEEYNVWGIFNIVALANSTVPVRRKAGFFSIIVALARL